MKVLQLCKFYPPVPGGIESVVRTLVEGLSLHDVCCDVLCAHTTNETVRETVPSGHHVTRVASLGKFLSTSMSPAIIRELAAVQSGYDVIHVHLPDPMTNLALCLTRPATRIVVHWHSDIVNQARALKFYAPLQQWLLKRASAIIATSRSYADASPWLHEVKDKVVTIPIGIEDPPAVPLARIEALRQRFGGRKMVFSLGRMTYYKGFGVLIDAARHLDDGTVVVIGGAGELLDQYQAQIRAAGLTDRVHLLGRLSDMEVAEFHAAADVYCLPSVARSEAFGVVLLEAMAAGKPVVASDIAGSGVPWVNVHGETGLNVGVGQPEALAGALRRIIADPVMSVRMGISARARYDLLFRADRMIDATRDLYINVSS